MSVVRTLTLRNGMRMPVLGQGTWYMGDHAGRRKEEIAALKLGLELGMTLIDTAEMYGSGRAELLVGDAIKGCRDDVFLVSKVLPSNASRKGVARACEASLKRLKTDRIDLYLLHWTSSHPLEETIRAFEALHVEGKIRAWGVSNFDNVEMAQTFAIAGGSACQSNQVLYNLTRRGIEHDLMPWCQERNVAIMAYSPVEQGRLLTHPALTGIAQRRGAKPAQVALAWVLQHDGVVAIPKAASREHVRENRGALDLELTAQDLAELDRAFPPPTGPVPLEML